MACFFLWNNASPDSQFPNIKAVPPSQASSTRRILLSPSIRDFASWAVFIMSILRALALALAIGACCRAYPKLRHHAENTIPAFRPSCRDKNCFTLRKPVCLRCAWSTPCDQDFIAIAVLLPSWAYNARDSRHTPCFLAFSSRMILTRRFSSAAFSACDDTICAAFLSFSAHSLFCCHCKTVKPILPC